MTNSKKQLVLVFPPMVTPTSPPLSIAMLKGYVQRQLPEWEVTLLDLNVWCFHLIFDGMKSGTVAPADNFYSALGATQEELLQAAKIMQGDDNEILFNRPDLYDQRSPVFAKFTQLLQSMLEAECRQWETTQIASPLLLACIQQIVNCKPTCVGISMIFSEQLPVGAALGRYLRQTLGVKVFFGGSCFTEGPEHFLKWYPHATDAVVTGDGEEALCQLLRANGDPTHVDGAAYIDSDGAVKRNPPNFQKNIDQFGSPDFSCLNLHTYFSPEPIVPLLLSRGCYWRKCTFCVHYFSAGDTYRMQSMDSVISMLKIFVQQGITNYSFVDEMIAPGHFVRLAQAIKAAGLDISYYALSKPNKTFTPAILKEVAESGCKYLLWGVESGNQRLLDLMGKGTSVHEVSDVLKNTYEAGIANHVFLICGFPTETFEEFDDTLQFLSENKKYIYAVHRGVFSLEAGSPISKDLKKFGIIETSVQKETPLGARLAYKVTSGVSMEEAEQNFRRAMPLFRAFHPHAQHLAYFRDHALLVYKRFGLNLWPEMRKFPSIGPTRILPAPLVNQAVDATNEA